MTAQPIWKFLGSGFFFAGVDQPAAGAGYTVGKDNDHDLAENKANEKAAKDVVERNLGQQGHSLLSNLGLNPVSQSIRAEP